MMLPLIAWLGYRSLRPDWVLITRNAIQSMNSGRRI